MNLEKFPRFPPLFSDMSSGLLPGDSQGTADMEACFDRHGNVFNDHCLAMDVFYRPGILALSRHVE
jgi:hypothetical protein